MKKTNLNIFNETLIKIGQTKNVGVRKKIVLLEKFLRGLKNEKYENKLKNYVKK